MSLFDRAKQFISGAGGSGVAEQDIEVSPEHEAILRRLRARYDYAVSMWREQRIRMKEDLRLMANDPFTELEKRQRGEKRPLVVTDHLGQYVSQIVNDVRRNKRGVNMMPKSIDIDRKEAERRANIARGIEHESDAQAVYWTMFEGAVTTGMGYGKLTRDYESVDSDKQVLRLVRNPNHLSVLPDPDVEKIDFGDMKFCFELSSLPYREFGDNYQDAQIQDFNGAVGDRLKAQFPSWVRQDDLQIARYWEVRKTPDVLLIMGAHNRRESELPEGAVWKPNGKNPKDGGWIENWTYEGNLSGQPVKVAKWRKVEVPSVWCYQTNGVEILDEYCWEDNCDSIPIYPCVGREQYVETGTVSGGSPSASGGTMRRFYVSAIRFTSWAIKGMAYVRSLQTELAQMTPKTPWMAVEGQLDNMKGWATLNTDPAAWVYYKGKLKAFGDTLLPPPTRLPFDPPIAALEALYQSFNEDVQQAMGMYRASVGNQSGSSSGKMVEELDKQSDQGQFHFIGNLNASMLRMWTDINRQMDKVYDTVRDVTSIRPDGTAEPVRLNDHSIGPKSFHMGTGEFAVQLSIGASEESALETGRKGMEAMVNANPELMNPEKPYSIGDQMAKAMGTGPIFDEMAKRLKPVGLQQEEDGNDPQALQQKLAMTGQELQQTKAQLQEAAKIIETKKIEAEADFRKESMKQAEENKRNADDNATAIKVAMIREAGQLDRKDHDAGEADKDRVVSSIDADAAEAHEREMQGADQAHAADMTAAGQEHEATMAERQAQLQAEQVKGEESE